MKKLKIISLAILTMTAISCNGQKKKSAKTLPVSKTEQQWKSELTAEQYHILREKGTERPFSGEYVGNFEPGSYVCAACDNLLFRSDAKFESDCGWPSFDQAIKGSVNYHDDSSFGMIRTEVTCANCGGHLGHVFDDGPTDTTGKRYCTNSISVRFIQQKK